MAISKYARPVVGAHEDGDVDLDRDRALVLRCQDGDGAAFAELYTQYHDRLHRFCMRRICDRDEAEEIAQEAFLKAWRALPTFSGGLRFYPWLTVIAKNLCTDALRKRARCGTVEDIDRQIGAVRLDPFSTTMSSEETVMATFDGELAAEAMNRLSDRHRHVLRLREEHGLSYQEIATNEGVEVSTVETLLWRARQALKREYAALSGTRVLGGLLIGGAALRRLAERFGRRIGRVALAFDRIHVRDVAAAGVITVALASVSGAAPSASSAVAPPTTQPTASAPQWIGWSTIGTPITTPLATGAPTTPTTPASSAGGGTPSGTTPSGGAPSLPTSGTPSLPSTPSLSQVASQLPPIAAQVPTTLSNVANTLNGVASTISQGLGTLPSVPTPPLPTPTLPNPTQTVTKTVTGLTGGLGGLGG